MFLEQSTYQWAATSPLKSASVAISDMLSLTMIFKPFFILISAPKFRVADIDFSFARRGWELWVSASRERNPPLGTVES